MNTKSINNIFAEVEDEGTDLELSQNREAEEQDPSSPESQPETKEDNPESKADDQKKDDEEKIPFHKHPRWKAMYEENKQLRNELTEIKEKLSEGVPSERSSRKETNVPDWWKDVYGDTEESVSAFEKWNKSTQEFKEQIKREALEEIKREQMQMQQAAQKAQEYLESQYQELVEDGAKVNKNELYKFIMDFQQEYGVAITDNQGNYDLKKAYALMSKMTDAKKADPTTVRKKEVAGASMAQRGGTPASDDIPVVKPHLLSRHTSWRDALN